MSFSQSNLQYIRQHQLISVLQKDTRNGWAKMGFYGQMKLQKFITQSVHSIPTSTFGLGFFELEKLPDRAKPFYSW